MVMVMIAHKGRGEVTHFGQHIPQRPQDHVNILGFDGQGRANLQDVVLGSLAADQDAMIAHPVFDKAALQAQDRIEAMHGRNNTRFAGAYNRHGFHEDGIASGMAVVELMNTQTAMVQGGASPLPDETANGTWLRNSA